jgi:hypothetical protein
MEQTFKELKMQYRAENEEMKTVYGDQFPSLPLIMRKRKKRPYTREHTQSVLRGYRSRCWNFLNAKKASGLEIVHQPSFTLQIQQP